MMPQMTESEAIMYRAELEKRVDELDYDRVEIAFTVFYNSLQERWMEGNLR